MNKDHDELLEAANLRLKDSEAVLSERQVQLLSQELPCVPGRPEHWTPELKEKK